MITLYHCASARSFRVLWLLEELELDYELVVLPFPPRIQQPSYLETNPLGTVPAFFDGSVRMTESAAICQYLVRRYGPTSLDVAVDEPDYGQFLNWLHFGEATLTFPLTLVLRYSRFEPEVRRQPQVVEDYTRWFFARLRAVESAITERDWPGRVNYHRGVALPPKIVPDKARGAGRSTPTIKPRNAGWRDFGRNPSGRGHFSAILRCRSFM